jgi:hypothetical protein
MSVHLSWMDSIVHVSATHLRVGRRAAHSQIPTACGLRVCLRQRVPRAKAGPPAAHCYQFRSARAVRIGVAAVSAATLAPPPEVPDAVLPAAGTLREGDALPADGVAASLDFVAEEPVPDAPWPPAGAAMPGMLEWSIVCCAETALENTYVPTRTLKNIGRESCSFIWFLSELNLNLQNNPGNHQLLSATGC